MPLLRNLTQEADPGANQGEAFTASIPTRTIVPEAGEAYYDSFVVGSLGGTSSGATNNTTIGMLAVLNPLQINAGSPLTQLRGRDIFALHSAWYRLPPVALAGGADEREFVYGMKIPLQLRTKPTENYSWSATRSAVANFGTERLQAALSFLHYVPGNAGRISAIEIAHTTDGSAGIERVTESLPAIGLLRGLLVFSNSVPLATADSATVQRLYLDTPSKTGYVNAHIGALTGAFRTGLDTASAGVQSALLNYGWLDLRDSPIDLRTQRVGLRIDSEETSAAARFVPVIEVPQ